MLNFYQQRPVFASKNHPRPLTRYRNISKASTQSVWTNHVGPFSVWTNPIMGFDFAWIWLVMRTDQLTAQVAPPVHNNQQLTSLPAAKLRSHVIYISWLKDFNKKTYLVIHLNPVHPSLGHHHAQVIPRPGSVSYARDPARDPHHISHKDQKGQWRPKKVIKGQNFTKSLISSIFNVKSSINENVILRKSCFSKIEIMKHNNVKKESPK
jgi:hypothetical protein